jgi:hypothetical protein
MYAWGVFSGANGKYPNPKTAFERRLFILLTTAALYRSNPSLTVTLTITLPVSRAAFAMGGYTGRAASLKEVGCL